MRAFNIDEFIESVKVNGPRLTCGVKGDWTGLYRRFLFTDNFEDWFRRRRREMRVKVVSLHLLALSDSVRITYQYRFVPIRNLIQCFDSPVW